MSAWVSVARARALGASMTDRARDDLVRYGCASWLVAAVICGWRTPPDLAGRRSAYAIPVALPWHPEREQRRKRRIQLLIARYS